ncbi:MAG: ABC transporter permease subunit [Acidimicrobiia bacterium]
MGEPPDTADERASRRRGGFRRRFIVLLVGIIAAVVVYAFAFEKTDVDLEEITSETRQASLFRILRALAHPDLVTFSTEEITVSTDVYLPCNPSAPAVAVPTSGPRLVMSPPCAEPGSVVTIEGIGFAGNETGTLAFIPDSEFAVSLRLERFAADASGNFSVETEIPERPSENPQQIEAVTSVNIGSLRNFFNPFDAPDTEWTDDNSDGIQDPDELVASPRWSTNATRTWELITETVMMALLATTLGTALAVPLSFFAAKNLMRDISTPVINLAMTIIALPIGIFLGVIGARAARSLSDPFIDSAWIELVGLIVLPLAMWLSFRWAVPETEDEPPTPGLRAARIGVLLAAAVAAILTLILLSAFALDIGDAIDRNGGALGFLGNFVARLGEILDVVISLIASLLGAGILMTFAGRFAYLLRSRFPRDVTRTISLFLAPVAGLVVGLGVGFAIDWFADFEGSLTLVVPGIIGALFGLYVALRSWNTESVGTGLVVYYMGRTLFNTLRSIEPLVMVIVFVVWIGVGPFAGSLALALHTTAALAKLYSEQVESIMTGPIEAIRATGATRIQTIVYAVVPQIVPPYISFTMYRWDINVRMSTIIGFAGGGGIGFLLQQNINLLQYQSAAAQMLAIAIVVATMDYISSRLRERLV